jgi:hypothetical protein
LATGGRPNPEMKGWVVRLEEKKCLAKKEGSIKIFWYVDQWKEIGIRKFRHEPGS